VFKKSIIYILYMILSMWIEYCVYIHVISMGLMWHLKQYWMNTEATYPLACISELWTTACLNLPQPASKLKVWKTPQAPIFHSFLCWGSGVKNSLIYSWFPPVQDYGGDIFTAFTFHCFCIWMIKQYFIIQMVKNDISK
jgi:hypothetical protein